MRPCYINATGGMRIRLDGPALSIHAPGQAAVLTPLSRISRVIISGSPECSAAVLLACAERGITVTFLHTDGAIRAHVFGQSMAENDLFIHLRDLLDRPDWPERYQLWLESAASRARISICRKLGIKPDSLTLKQICLGMNQYMEQFVSASHRDYLQRRLRGMCSNLVSQVIQDVGLDKKYSRYFEPRLDIPGDFTNLVSLSLQAPLLEWLRRQPTGKRIDDRDVVALFERHSRRLENLTRRLSSRLHAFLIEMI